MTIQNLLKTASVRDFSGGLNLTDNPYNLASKYQMVSDNVIVGPDGALSPRMGYQFIGNLRNGTVTQHTNPPITSVQFFSSSSRVRMIWTAHGMTDLWTINFKTPIQIGSVAVNPLISGAFSVDVIDANTFEIYTRQSATAASTNTTLPAFGSVERSTHILPGNILEMAFFQGSLVIFDDIGNIVAVRDLSGTLTIERIWDAAHAAATVNAPAPWRGAADGTRIRHISYATFKQTLLAVNGRLFDKPLEINFQRPNGTAPVQYLVDPALTTNANVYAADLIQAFDGYVLLHASNNTSLTTNLTITSVDISAKNTSGVFVGNPNPDDAVNIDLGRASQTVEPRITGVSYIRNKVFIAFPDSAMLGTLGLYNADIHEPDFSDQVPQHGALNHRVIQNIGNDLFMCDYAGIPAFSQSLQSGVIAPERLSQLIYPELNRHLSRLSQDTLRYKIWSLYSVRDRMYMLFVPKFDSASVRTSTGEVAFVVTDFRADQEIIIQLPNHGVSAGDYVNIVITGWACAGLAVGDVAGVRRVVAVIDDNNILVKVGAIPTVDGAIGTCTTLTATPVDDESICYAYQYNPTLRIRRWTRFRGWYFIAGTTSNDGRVFLADREGRLWRMGTIDRPVYADQVGYTTDDPEHPLSGIAIPWVAETPWSDFADRIAMKVGEHATFDVEGFGKFEFTLFVDNIHDDKATYTLSPAASTFVATVPTYYGEDANAFGAGAQTYGMGRRAREQVNYHFPFRCKLAKMRFQGNAKEYLRIIAVTLSYKKGSIYR